MEVNKVETTRYQIKGSKKLFETEEQAHSSYRSSWLATYINHKQVEEMDNVFSDIYVCSIRIIYCVLPLKEVSVFTEEDYENYFKYNVHDWKEYDKSFIEKILSCTEETIYLFVSTLYDFSPDTIHKYCVICETDKEIFNQQLQQICTDRLQELNEQFKDCYI